MKIKNSTGKQISFMLGSEKADEPDYWWTIEDKETKKIDDNVFPSDFCDFIEIGKVTVVE
jgi:hypothetical protein